MDDTDYELLAAMVAGLNTAEGAPSAEVVDFATEPAELTLSNLEWVQIITVAEAWMEALESNGGTVSPVLELAVRRLTEGLVESNLLNIVSLIGADEEGER